MNSDNIKVVSTFDLINIPKYENIDIEKEYFNMVIKRIALKKKIKDYIFFTLMFSLASSLIVFSLFFYDILNFNISNKGNFEIGIIFSAANFILFNFVSVVYKMISTPLEILKKPRKEVAEFNVRVNMFKSELQKESISDEKVMQIFDYCNSALSEKVKY
jgi:hypothetical protein